MAAEKTFEQLMELSKEDLIAEAEIWKMEKPEIDFKQGDKKIDIAKAMLKPFEDDEQEEKPFVIEKEAPKPEVMIKPGDKFKVKNMIKENGVYIKPGEDYNGDFAEKLLASGTIEKK